MPISLNYGSTGRPPGEYHLRHSFKEITDNLESPYPPFDIFSNRALQAVSSQICLD
jgi:hypothetical protein